MSYGQKDFNEIQGINGRYRINQIGCFLVAFCNLYERFGRSVDPLTLNREFRNRNIWIDSDDGIKDDLTWSAISKYDPHIVITGTGLGAPSSNNSIVKFTGVSNRWRTHFSLVADASKGLIVDSWDGKVKHWNAYGGPKAWATYVDNKPKPVPTPPPAPAPVVVAAPQSDTVAVKIQVGWGLSHALKAVGYSKEQYSNPKEWERLAVLNNAPNGLRVKPNQVIQVYRTPLSLEAPVAPPPAPIVEPPVTVADVPIPFIESDVIPVKVVASDPKAYQSTAQLVSQVYIATESVAVKDMEGLHIDKQLVKGRKIIGAQVFEKAGKKYVRTQKSMEAGQWYGIPMEYLTPGQDPDAYVGPLVQDEDDDALFSLDMAMEAREMLNHLSGREKIIVAIAKLQGLWIKITQAIKKKK